MEESQQTYKEIYSALAKAQGQFPPIVKDKEVRVNLKDNKGSYTFKYAPLDTILAAVRKPLSENGIALFQNITENHIVTILAHSSGEELHLAPIQIKPSDSGVQALGSAITYCRRYSITIALGIASDDDDDGNRGDGNGIGGKGKGSPQQKKPTVSPYEQIEKWIDDLCSGNNPKKTKLTAEELASWYSDDNNKKLVETKQLLAPEDLARINKYYEQVKNTMSPVSKQDVSSQF